MATSIASHKVNDYATWRKAFDEFAPVRKAGGELSCTVLQADDDPNFVTVINTWDSIATAKTFFGKDELRTAMKDAGVASSPEFIFGNEK